MTAKIGVATAAIYGVKRAFFDTALQIASATNEIEKQSKLLGMSIDTYQKWTYAAKLSDVEIQEFSLGLRLLSRNMEDASQGAGDASKYFSAMGISVKDTAGHLRPLNEVMLNIMDKFASWEEGPRKIAISLALFGRGGEALIPLLNKGREGFQDFAREAEKLGIILSPDLVRKGSEAEDAFKRIRAAWEATKMSFAPAAKVIADAVEIVLAPINLVVAGLKKIEDFSTRNQMWKENVGLAKPEWIEPWTDLGKAQAEARGKSQPPALTDLKKYFEEQKSYYESLAKQAEQIERLAYGGMENKAFFDELQRGKEIEENIKRIELERAQQLADDMFPSLETVNRMIDQGNQYSEKQRVLLALIQGLVKDFGWKDYAAGLDAANEGTRQLTQLMIQNAGAADDALEREKRWLMSRSRSGDLFRRPGPRISPR
jgi:hypothetical protein